MTTKKKQQKIAEINKFCKISDEKIKAVVDNFTPAELEKLYFEINKKLRFDPFALIRKNNGID